MSVSFQVSQGNVPGVESASLAMDTEEGVEVVWNEVLFSDKKVFKAQEVPRLCSLAEQFCHIDGSSTSCHFVSLYNEFFNTLFDISVQIFL